MVLRHLVVLVDLVARYRQQNLVVPEGQVDREYQLPLGDHVVLVGQLKTYLQVLGDR
jgi:hypothetical protein